MGAYDGQSHLKKFPKMNVMKLCLGIKLEEDAYAERQPSSSLNSATISIAIT
jgi:hypothetical protein